MLTHSWCGCPLSDDRRSVGAAWDEVVVTWPVCFQEPAAMRCAERLDAYDRGVDAEGCGPYALGLAVMESWTTVDGAALRAARIRAGLTQHELAHLIGVAGGERISIWELGTSAPRAETLPSLAKALAIPISGLLPESQGSPDFRRLRLLAGHSQQMIAARAHVSKATVARWDRGHFVRTPHRDELRELGRLLGVSASAVETALNLSRERASTPGRTSPR